MNRWLLLLLSLLLVQSARAQRQPHTAYVYPAGGRQGTTFEAVVGGQYLLNSTNVFVSGAGVRANVIEQEEPLRPNEVQELRDLAGKLQAKRKQGERLTPEELKQAEEIRKKLMVVERKRANPALGEFVTLEITVAKNAPPGKRELRLETQAGLSNPLVFCVGQLPEVSKSDWKSPPPRQFDRDAKPATPAEIAVTLPVTVNGQIPPGGVDRYRFSARAKQQLVVAVSARELIPYLADAVPGWFQATVTLFDATGKELAYADDFRFHPDPVLFYKIPKDGEYVLEIKDALYRGREDFVYRITAGEVPFVTGVYPLGGQAGAPLTIALSGWNLPFNQITLDLRTTEPGTHPFAVAPLSNRVPLAVDTLPELFETEPNNTLTNAQPVTMPVIINGRVNKPGDWDVFRFEGRAGDLLVAEVLARRLDSPLDSVLKLTDATGQQLAFNDDHEDKASGLNTHHADSYLTATLPMNGTYYVYLGDTQHHGSPAYTYRLRLSAPRPDFELRVVPSTLTIRGGASAPLTVWALRQDGFAGEIAVALKDATSGFKLSAAQIPANQDQVKLTLTAPAAATPGPVTVKLEGCAHIQGNQVVHAAVPADDMMQAFIYRHLVPAQDLNVAVVGRFRSGETARILTATPIRIPAGGSARVQVSLPTGPLAKKIAYELSDPPEGISVQTMSPTEIMLHTDAAKIKPGLKGNLIVKASAERPPPSGNQPPPANQRRIALGALPAIPFEIVSR